MLCDDSAGCEEVDIDDHFATEAGTMMDVSYESYSGEI